MAIDGHKCGFHGFTYTCIHTSRSFRFPYTLLKPVYVVEKKTYVPEHLSSPVNVWLSAN